ncbi:hypothetical protein LOK49_LG10G01002 [Camellia lanceoleosa]|uniref:Uncharacterized protein n=1 Tax=Camellia lanceoleosa TaxID=1840588 RepID=A0ACC0G9I7_9ERIC|nr:hypothetical protein LOK49_LG10G01002 [Camellia lanceoleosa]
MEQNKLFRSNSLLYELYALFLEVKGKLADACIAYPLGISRLICGRIRGVGSRQMSEIESRIDLEQAANIEAEGSGIPEAELMI